MSANNDDWTSIQCEKSVDLLYSMLTRFRFSLSHVVCKTQSVWFGAVCSLFCCSSLMAKTHAHGMTKITLRTVCVYLFIYNGNDTFSPIIHLQHTMSILMYSCIFKHSNMIIVLYSKQTRKVMCCEATSQSVSQSSGAKCQKLWLLPRQP